MNENKENGALKNTRIMSHFARHISGSTYNKKE